jgi:transcriptional regulator with XRE-family HTH domain
MRVLRRRFGLTQRELAYLLGYESDTQVSRFENGVRIPHLAEVLVIELLFGVPAITVFPKIRQAVGHRVRNRVKLLLSDIGKSPSSSNPRKSYKTAQLERVMASLKAQDEFDQSGPYL